MLYKTAIVFYQGLKEVVLKEGDYVKLLIYNDEILQDTIKRIDTTEFQEIDFGCGRTIDIEDITEVIEINGKKV